MATVRVRSCECEKARAEHALTDAGVLNTDNMSILGLTIDYGPYGFMDRSAIAWFPEEGPPCALALFLFIALSGNACAKVLLPAM